MTKKMRVGIVGAGIGGVALARALRLRGIDAWLFERASGFGEIGAGVQMTPNAAKALIALGVGEGLKRIGFLPEAMIGLNWNDAAELFYTPLRETCPRLFGAHFYHVHRADLHGILSEGMPMDQVRFNAQCTGVTQRGDMAVAQFSDGSSFEADLIVGADGIHSVVRDGLWGKSEARFTGHMCWRALVPVEHHPLPFVRPAASFWMGPKAHVVTYYVKSGAAVNIVAVNESADWVAESWTEPSTRDELMAAYQGWHQDLIRLFELTDPEQTFKWGLFDRDPMQQWSQGRITLLGDAAHPMLQYLAQGAGMAIEDAVVLGAALQEANGDFAAAFQRYQSVRYLRTGRVQLTARFYGDIYHASGVTRELRNQMFQSGTEAAGFAGLSWLYKGLNPDNLLAPTPAGKVG